MVAEELPDLSIKIKADVHDAVDGIAEVEAAEKSLGKTTDETTAKVKKGSKDQGDASKELSKILGSNLKDGENSFKSLGKSIDEEKAKLSGLRKEFSSNPSSSLFGDIKKSQKGLKDLMSTAGTLGFDFAKDGEKAASSFGNQFTSALGEVPIGPVLITALVGAAALAAPAVVAVLGTALATGLAGAGIAGGIMLAAKSPEVKSAAATLKNTLVDDLSGFGDAFIKPTEAGIKDLTGDLGTLAPGLSKTGSILASFVKPLADGLGRAAQVFMPLFEKGLQGAAPLIGTLSNDLPGLAHDVGVMFDDFGKGGSGANLALTSLIQGVGGLAVGFGEVYDWSTKTFMSMQQGFVHVINLEADLIKGMSYIAGGTNGPLGRMADHLHQIADNEQGVIDQSKLTATGVTVMGSGFDQVTQQIIDNDTAFTALTAAMLANESQMDANDSKLLTLKQDELAWNTLLKKHTVDWNLNTAAGLKSFQTLTSVDQATQAYYGNVAGGIPMTEAQTKADLAATSQLLKQAKASGATSTETATLRQRIKDLKAELAGLHNKTIKVKLVESGSNVPAKIAAQLNEHRNSGIASYAASGVFDGSVGAAYRFAEQGTIKEALVAKNGDSGRAMATLREAAAWHDSAVVSTRGSGSGGFGGMGGGSGSPMLFATIMIDSRTVATALIPTVQKMNSRANIPVLA